MSRLDVRPATPWPEEGGPWERGCGGRATIGYSVNEMVIDTMRWRNVGDMKNFLFARASAVCFRRMSSSAESVVQYISPAPQEFVAYRELLGKSPGVIFLPGLMSNMDGTKALALERYCRSIGHSYVRFDYRGHGMSSGTSQDCTIRMRKADVLAVLDKVAKGKLPNFPA